MRFGCMLPTLGPLAGPDALTRAAQRAEALDYHSVWVADRLRIRSPRGPRTRSPPTAPCRSTSSVAWTRWRPSPSRPRTRVGSPSGRASSAGLSTTRSCSRDGWPRSTSCPAGASASGSARPGRPTGSRRSAPTPRFGVASRRVHRGAEGDVGPDPVEFQGQRLRVARSIVGLKPVRRPRPPIYLAAYVAPALRRTASLADGWLASSLPLAAVDQMVPQLTRSPARQGAIRPTSKSSTWRVPRSRARPFPRASAVFSAAARCRCALTSGGSATSASPR